MDYYSQWLFSSAPVNHDSVTVTVNNQQVYLRLTSINLIHLRDVQMPLASLKTCNINSDLNLLKIIKRKWMTGVAPLSLCYCYVNTKGCININRHRAFISHWEQYGTVMAAGHTSPQCYWPFLLDIRSPAWYWCSPAEGVTNFMSSPKSWGSWLDWQNPCATIKLAQNNWGRLIKVKV